MKKLKKVFAILMMTILACSMAACQKEPAPAPSDEMPQEMAAMAAPIDALARCMLENDLTYDPNDPDFFWTSLFYFTGAYGLEHELVTEEEGTYQLNIPTAVMQEHASALFAEYDGLFDLPSIMKGNISYDPAEDVYSVSRGDIGLSEMRLSNYEKTETGYTLLAELHSTDPTDEGDSLIAAWEVTLVDNAYADGIENPVYLYSVAAMKQIENNSPNHSTAAGDDTPTLTSTEKTTAIFNGLSDSHTVELTLPDGTVQAFQFDTDTEAAEVFGSLAEGDGLTIHYTEAANGALMITTVE